MKFPYHLPVLTRNLYLAFLLISGLASQAQVTWEPANYYGVPDRDKQAVFQDDFEDNRNKWDMGSLYLSERIEEGDYYCASLTSQLCSKHRPVAVDGSGNYEMEVRLRYIKGEEGSPAGLVFGRDSRGNEYSFQFNAGGNFTILRNDRGRSYEVKPWEACRYLNRFSYNSLMVRKAADQWYFFINQELVAKMPAQPLYGSDVGFMMGGNMAVEVDFMRISELKTSDNTGPQISLIEPAVTEMDTVYLTERYQIIRGKVYDASGINSLSINGQPITISQSGLFTASLSLPEGVTRIDIAAKDRYNNVSNQRVFLAYSPENTQAYTQNFQNFPKPQEPLYESNPAPAKPATTAPLSNNSGLMGSPDVSRGGSSYLLVIGINEYQNWNKLHNAVKDCKDVAQTLVDMYQFDADHIISLYNEQATREGILETLETLQEKLTENDNLLIYYAGHGYYDENSKLGYWVPSDARLNKVPDYILNSTIHDYLRTINSHHTLLIADACYSGSLFATYRGPVNEESRSRWAFTSGDIEKVWDGQPGQNSPFAKYLIRYLRNNTKPRLLASEVIDAVGYLVHQSTSQSPQGSPLKQAGDDGGVFVFIRKN
ncbi:MAG: caspase family protein [Bacteroidetes bacterium]|nr:MAG: caspase family protein [Bacteroidota bacterium]